MTYDSDRRLNLARGLRAARKNAGLNAAVAANRIASRGIKCTRGALLAWERGAGNTSREPYASDLPVIASVYGCMVAELFAAPADEKTDNWMPDGVVASVDAAL